MREIWPCSIASAALYQKKILESLEERFQIDINYINGISHFKLRPKENVDGTFHFKQRGETNISQKLSNLFERGVNVEFEPSEFEITGSKLFEKFSKDFSKSKVVVQACRESSCQVSIFSSDKYVKNKSILHRGFLGNY